MPFFKNLFGVENKFDKPVADTNTIARASGVQGSVSSFNGYTLNNTNKWSLENAVDHAYAKVVWVFRAVHTIAAAQAGLEIRLRDRSTDYGEFVEDKNFWRLMNKRPNVYEDAWTFRYRLSSQLLLSPKGAFIEVVKKNNDIAELYLLNPENVNVIKSATKWVDHYEVTRGSKQVDSLDPEQIVWVMTSPHPTDPYRNVTPLESAGVSIETDFFARLFNRNFLKKDGRPSMLIGINGDMLPEDADELKNLFTGGYSVAGEVRVIEADNINVADFSTKPRDAQWKEALDSAKENILAAFGVPESVLGNASGRCLRATELIHLANGEMKAAQELVGQTFELMQPFEGSQRPIKAKAEYAKHENVFKITTFSGRTLEVNGEHPLYMALSRTKSNATGYRNTKRDIFPYGWTALNEIKDAFDSNDRLKKGVYTEVAVPLWYEQAYSEYLDPQEAYNLGVAFEDVPESVFTAQIEAQRAFISGVYTAHGRLSQHTGFDLYVPTKEYARKLQILLLRIGVASYIGSKKMTHTVCISGFVNMRHFLDQIELTGKQKENAEKVRERIDLKSEDARQEGILRTDALPPGMVWDRILDIEDLGEDDTVAISIDDPQERHYMSLFWEHNTYNNADAEGENFWTQVMVPHCNAIAGALEPVTGDDKDTTYLEFDWESVDVLMAAKRRQLDRVRQDLNNGAITMNDYRKELGQAPVEEAFFRVYFHPNGAIGGDPKDVQEVMRQMLSMNGTAAPNQNPMGNPFTTNTPTGGDGTVGGFNDQAQGEAAASGGDHSQTVFDQAARTLRSSRVNNVPPDFANPRASSEIHNRVRNLINKKVDRVPTYPHDVRTANDIHRDLRHKTTGFIEGSLESWSNRQLSVVSDRLTHTKVRKGTRHWDGEPGTKALDVNYIVDVEEWTQDATNTIITGLKSALYRESQVHSNDLKDNGVKPKNGDSFITKSEVDAICDDLQERLQKSLEQQSKLIQRHIEVQDKSGFDIESMQDVLQNPNNFDRYNWITLLSKRITTNAIESMYDNLYNNVDAKVTKTWKVSPAEAFRDNHAALNDVKVPASSQFDAPYGKISFPTAIMSSEGDNCSCWTVYGLES